MITWKQAEERIEVRSSRRIPTEDQDTGTVVDHNRYAVGNQEVEVLWSNDQRSWQTRASLFAR